MSVNTAFYGSTLGIRIRGGAATPGYTDTGIYAANFSGVLPATETAGQLNAGVNAGRFAFGDPIDGSIQTHGIQRNDDTYNTFANYSGIDAMGSTDNMAIEQSRNASIPILFGYHPRTSQTYNTNYTARPVSYQNVLWGVDKSGSPDGTSLVPIVQMDFKTLLYVPVIIASTNYYNSTPDQYGRYTLNSSWRSAVVMTLDTYINNYFLTYPVVQGVGLMSFAVSLDDTGAIPDFELSKCRMSNHVAPFRNIYYNWTAGTISGGQRMPTDGTIITSGMDLCGPFMVQRDVTFNYTNTAGTTTSFQELTGGNIPLILGCTCSVEGYRRQSPDLIRDFWQGVTACVGANHIRMALQSNAKYVQIPVWYDAPQDPQMFKDAVHKMLSYLGVMWADEIGGIETGDTPLYIGIINEQGLTTGEYIQLTNPDDVAQLASDNWINDTNYDPGRIDPNTYTDTMPTGQAPPVQSCNRYYALNATNIGRLYEGLLNTLSSVPTGEMEDYLLSHFATNSPIDLLNNLKWLPFDFVSRCFDTSGEHTIFIGGLPIHDNNGNAVTGYRARAATEFSITITIGNFNLFRHFNDFRDFEPYTGVDVYIPFCTPIALKPSMAMGHDIIVQISIDIITGNITGRLRLDSSMGIIIGTTNGNCAIDLPISGVDTATYNNAMYQAVQNAKSADRGLAAAYIGAVTGGASSIAGTAGATEKKPLSPAAAVSGVGTAVSSTFGTVNAWQNKINADYQLSHVPVPYHNISAVNSALAMLQPLHTYVIISRPVMLPGYNAQYGHTTGYATIYNGTLDGLSGLTVCASADLSGIPATAEEKEMISAALKSGVYL